ncbi:hypothetical protein [Nevskia ramosa]|uniref:hypothetical protein n=1 Tax=Nevskia ramosa TaxID=64002 RepID=UPI0003B4AE75|nr:hypothetical protein [Nevskia ramosa]
MSKPGGVGRLFKWVLGLVAAGGLALAAAALGFWLYANLFVGLTITDQAGMITLPPKFTAYAQATNNVTIKLDGYIDAIVPFKQTLDLPIEGDYTADIDFDTVVPVKFTIEYSGLIPVDTFADIEGRTDFVYQNVKRLRNVAFKGRVPLQFEQPVKFVVPIDTSLRVKFHGPIGLKLNQTIKAPVDTVLKTRIKAQREVTTPILARFGLEVTSPTEAIPVIIQHSDLRLKADTLRLEKAPDILLPQRPQPGHRTEPSTAGEPAS